MGIARKTALLLVVALLVSALGVFALGCSSSSTTTTAGGGTTTTAGTATTTGKNVTIGITQIVSHPALDATVKGFKAALAKQGFVAGKNVTYDDQNAQGDMATAASIAQKFVSENVNLILSVATPTSQAAAKATQTIPIVFAAVTDPVAAGLVKDPKAPEGNITGVSDLLPLQPHLDLIKKLVPDVKTIGLLYNAGEANSVALVKEEKTKAEAMGIKVVEATAASSAEVQQAAQSLVGRVDAMSVLTDNTVVSALESVVKVAKDNKIPLIAGDTDSVKRGAVAAYAFNYLDLGTQAGEMAAKILNGTPIKDIPVEYANKLILSVNPTSAKAMGVTLPTELMTTAVTY
jgi:putative ABC transport system substrate-binding protein